MESVALNVGGKVFQTTRKTLLRFKDSYFTELLSSKPQDNGKYFVDLDPEVFDSILEYLQDGILSFTSFDQEDSIILLSSLKALDIPLPYNVWDPSHFSNSNSSFMLDSDLKQIIVTIDCSRDHSGVFSFKALGFQPCDSYSIALENTTSVQYFIYVGFASKHGLFQTTMPLKLYTNYSPSFHRHKVFSVVFYRSKNVIELKDADGKVLSDIKTQQYDGVVYPYIIVPPMLNSQLDDEGLQKEVKFCIE